jgi:hypothetical protein
MQAAVRAPLSGVPAKPDCLVWYAGDPCDEQIQQYHRAAEAQSQVSSSLQRQLIDQQKQIAEQQNQIRALQLRMETQTIEASQNDARNESLLHGIGAGIGAALALLVAVASFRKLVRGADTGRRAASV